MIHLEEDLLFQIYAIVEEIPVGKVATYKDIATLLGREKNCRLIGKAMSISSMYGNFPCHRVVNHQGRLVPGWKEQRDLLQKEKVKFKENGYVNLKQCRWNIEK